MLEHILKFPTYVSQGYELGKNFKVKGKVNKIIVCGVGGSGISAYILKDYIQSLPILINQNYDVPEFIDKNTLAIIISYSGDTEEIVSAYGKIKGKTKKMFIIASGGILGEEKNVVEVPQGFPPRYSLPFLFFSMLSVLNNSNIVKKDFSLDEVVKNLRSVNFVEAKDFARRIVDCIPLIYAPEGYGSVAYRWQTQFNENSKILAHSHVFPEHNHNEIEANLSQGFKPIMLRASDVHERINLRMDVFSAVLNPEQVELKGDSRISKMFYGILFGDFTSYYLALEYGINPGQQPRIDALKEKLKE